MATAATRKDQARQAAKDVQFCLRMMHQQLPESVDMPALVLAIDVLETIIQTPDNDDLPTQRVVATLAPKEPQQQLQ